MSEPRPSDHILLSREAGLLTVQLNRPDKKNALTQIMYGQLAEAFEQADRDPEIQAVLLTGSTDCFTAGNDIANFLEERLQPDQSPVFGFMRSMIQFSKPVVAAVSGAAVGIGTTVLLHCDLVFVSRDARLQMPFVKLGLCPEFGSSLLLPQRLGHARAAELILLGKALNGQQAVEWGLANEVLEDGAATLARARAVAHSFEQLAPEALRVSKMLLKAGQRERLLQVIGEEAELFAQRLRSPEAIAAFAGFLAKR